ncbi:MAG: hypothetical protein ACREQZ_11470 [Woeseiaceae bacterium]
MTTYSTLDIGAPKDGVSWNKGCKELGMQLKTSIIDRTPTMGQLADFFQRMPDWLYFSGHLSLQELYNDAETVKIGFSDDGVTVTAGGQSRTLTKAAGDFQLHQECALVLFGGCSALRDDEDIRSYRRLFDNPVLLGYAGGCGVDMNDAMLGGDFIRNDFFNRVRNKMAQNDRHAVRDAWMETARWGYGGGIYEERLRAVDQDGQEWILSGKQIVKGRKL